MFIDKYYYSVEYKLLNCLHNKKQMRKQTEKTHLTYCPQKWDFLVVKMKRYGKINSNYYKSRGLNKAFNMGGVPLLVKKALHRPNKKSYMS